MAGPFLDREGYAPLGLWDSSAETFVLGGVRRARASHMAGYRKLQEDLHDLYDGEHHDVMVQHLNVTHPRVAPRWNLGGGSGHRYLNVTELVVRTLSVVFHRAPELALTDGGTPIDLGDPAAVQWERDMADVSIASALRQWDCWTSLFRTSLLQPSYQTVDGRGKMRWTVHAPYSVSVVQGAEDPSDVATAQAVRVELPQGVDSVGTPRPVTMCDWTRLADAQGRAAYRMRTSANGKEIENTLFKDGVNRYGLHPFVVARDGQPAAGEFFLPARSPLFRLQTWVNATLSDEAWGLRFQTHATPVLNGWENESPPSFDPGEPIVNRDGNPEHFSLEFKTPSSNIGLAQTALENALRWYAVSEGMPAELFSGQTSVRNLAAMKMATHYLQLRRVERIPMYRAALKRAFEVHRAIGNWHARNTPGSGRTVIPEHLELTIGFAPISYPSEEASHAQAVKVRIELGLTNPVDELMVEHGISRAEAQAMVRRNREVNAELALQTSPLPAAAASSDSTLVTPPDQRRGEGEPSPHGPGRPEA